MLTNDTLNRFRDDMIKLSKKYPFVEMVRINDESWSTMCESFDVTLSEPKGHTEQHIEEKDGCMIFETLEVKRPGDIAELMDGMETAWALIANAESASWDADPQSEGEKIWRVAAERWRDEMWHPALKKYGIVEKGWIDDAPNEFRGERIDEEQ